MMHPSAAVPNHRRFCSKRSRHRAFALVVVLIILSLLAVVAVSFLASMSNERTTANALTNKMRAEQAAQAGVDSAIATLRECFRAFPDSATAWESAQSQTSGATGEGATNAGTSLYVRAVPGNDQNTPNAALDADNRPPHDPAAPTAADPRKTFVLPLVSGASFQQAANKANAINNGAALSLTDDKSVDLNARRKQGDTEGVLGSPPITDPNQAQRTAPKPVRVPWVEIQQQGTANPATAPVIARYAFWVEDESFRANINYANLGESNAHVRADNTINPTKRSNPYPPYGLNAGDVDLLGIFKALGGASPDQDAKSLFDVRAFFPASVFPESRAFAHATGLTPPRYADIYGNANLTADQKDQKALARYVDQISYYTTTRSAALNLSRHGSQRLNLNALINNDPTHAQTEVDTIVKTIAFHTPAFGQRFYRNSTEVTPAVLNAPSVRGDDKNPDHAKIYLYKVAANIRDYIDTDYMPTFVDKTGIVTTNADPNGARPTLPLADPIIDPINPLWAAGKDSALVISECAARYTGSIDTKPDGRHYTLNCDYYIELWNLTNQDISHTKLGPNQFIRISNPPQWKARTSTTDPNPLLPIEDGGTPSPADTRQSPPLRDNEIDISGIDFPAGSAVVITTDPNYKDIIPDTNKEASKHVVRLDFQKGKRTYTGKMPGNTTELFLFFQPATGSAASDYDTDLVIGNDHGFMDYLNASPPIAAAPASKISLPYAAGAPQFNLYGGVLRGNWTNTPGSAVNEGKQASAIGDPRSNQEQLALTPPDAPPSQYPAEQRTRFNNFTSAGVTQTFGLPNYLSVRPNRPENPWPDYPPFYANPNTPTPDELVMTPTNAPMIVANAPLTSIGQLGDAYDPARIIVAGATNYSRGGGRTFKIGQHDDRWDGDANSASRTWTSWRLADFFDTSDSILQYGLINLNGVARDNGAALKAALTGLKFQPSPQGDPKLSGAVTGTPAELKVDNLVKQITYRLTSPATANGQPNTGFRQTGAGPFWERGEISELPGFGRTPTPPPSPATLYSTTTPQDNPPAELPLDLTGKDMSKEVNDRGREELVRRLINMTTTRGDVFTVYALGQSFIQSNPGDIKTRRVTGTHQLKVTFRLIPQRAANDPDGPGEFHPLYKDGGDPKTYTADQYVDRFRKPDHYDIQILSASSSGGG